MQSLQNQFVTAMAVESVHIKHIIAPRVKIIIRVAKLRLFEPLHATLCAFRKIMYLSFQK